LAKVYARNPAEFLAQPLDEVMQHIWWTDQLLATAEARTQH
jgi:hypothetical protein